MAEADPQATLKRTMFNLHEAKTHLSRLVDRAHRARRSSSPRLGCPTPSWSRSSRLSSHPASRAGSRICWGPRGGGARMVVLHQRGAGRNRERQHISAEALMRLLLTPTRSMVVERPVPAGHCENSDDQSRQSGIRQRGDWMGTRDRRSEKGSSSFAAACRRSAKTWSVTASIISPITEQHGVHGGSLPGPEDPIDRIIAAQAD